MEVYKFGGASVKDAEGIKNLCSIVRNTGGKLIVIVSALGKTTNALEDVVTDLLSGGNDYKKDLEKIIAYHNNIIDELCQNKNPEFNLDREIKELLDVINNCKNREYDYLYDQVVSFGEILSTKIIHWWLSKGGVDCNWLDVRKVLFTDRRYRDANINWELSEKRVQEYISETKERVLITQGFIASTEHGDSTTLGREGSDFTAGILANITDAERVTIWKDVPGVLNADPDWFSDTIKLQNISYKEAVELSFSGAKVIHPKTIKPLHNKSIPLFVRSFIDIENPGTVISVDKSIDQDIPLYVKKDNQALLSLMPRDFSFVIGDHLGDLFHTFYRAGIKINLVQTSAVSIAVCVDNDKLKLPVLIEELEGDYKILTNAGAELITLRYYTPESVDKVLKSKEVLLEQKTRKTIRYVIREKDS